VFTAQVSTPFCQRAFEELRQEYRAEREFIPPDGRPLYWRVRAALDEVSRDYRGQVGAAHLPHLGDGQSTPLLPTRLGVSTEDCTDGNSRRAMTRSICFWSLASKSALQRTGWNSSRQIFFPTSQNRRAT